MALTDKLTAIGDAIRAKTGGTDPIDLTDMPAQIEGISGGFPNGTEWTQSNMTSAVDVVCYGKGIWVGGKYSGGFWHSTDGMTWTQSNVTSGGPKANILCPNDDIFVAGSSAGMWYSTDGMTWVQSNVTSGNTYCLEYGNGVFVASLYSGDTYYSTDGMTWTDCSPSSMQKTLYSIGYAKGVWLAEADGKFHRSIDGMTWTNLGSIATGSVNGIHYANGVWVFATNNGLWYSTDGATLTQSNITQNTFYSAYFANGIWVTFGSYSTNTGIWYSTDGMTWMQSNVSNKAYYTSKDSLSYANGVWVVGTYKKGLFYSTDGMTWTAGNIPDIAVYKAFNANGMWVVPTANGFYYSPTWLPS